MSDGTKIEWTDATWNIITGCSVVSAGCKHCYAMKLAGTRLRNHPSRIGLTVDTPAGPVWSGHVRFNGEWLDQPLKWKRPRRIFVCAHGDLFHEQVTEEMLDQVFAVMALAQQHTFQVLTKRPERAAAYLNDPDRFMEILDRIKYDPRAAKTEWPLANVHLGTSVENQEAANERIPWLLKAPAAVRFLSAEPLLGRISLRSIPAGEGRMDGMPCTLFQDPLTGFRATSPYSGQEGGPRLGWVIVGGESGPGARPMHPAWARALRDQCAAAGVAFFFKQWGDWSPEPKDGNGAGGLWVSPDGRVMESLQGELYPQFHMRMYQVGKKAAGRLLDGQEYNEMPGDVPRGTV